MGAFHGRGGTYCPLVFQARCMFPERKVAFLCYFTYLDAFPARWGFMAHASKGQTCTISILLKLFQS